MDTATEPTVIVIDRADLDLLLLAAQAHRGALIHPSRRDHTTAERIRGACLRIAEAAR